MKRTIDISVSDLSNLAVFVKVAGCLNFSLAADRLGLGKATVSDHIARLERALGVRLLVRTTRSVKLTEAGELFLAHCQRVMSDMDAAFAAVGALREKPKGHLRVSVPNAIGRQLVAPIIPKFLEQYPEVSLELDCTNRFVDFAAESIDIAIRHTENLNPNYMAWKLYEFSYYLVASPNYLKRHGTPKRPSDLSHHNCVSYSLRGGQSEWRFLNGEQIESVTIAGNFTANNNEIVREAVLGGIGVALLPEFCCHPYLEEKKMISLFDSYKIEGGFGNRIHAVSLWSPNVAPKTRAFIDFLRDEFHRVQQDRLNL